MRYEPVEKLLNVPLDLEIVYIDTFEDNVMYSIRIFSQQGYDINFNFMKNMIGEGFFRFEIRFIFISNRVKELFNFNMENLKLIAYRVKISKLLKNLELSESKSGNTIYLKFNQIDSKEIIDEIIKELEYAANCVEHVCSITPEDKKD